MICIVGCAEHHQVKRVRESLLSAGSEVVVVDYRADTPLRAELTENGSFSFSYGDVNLSQAHVVWAADKYIFSRFGADEEWANSYVAHVQWKETARNLLRVLPGRVANCPEAVFRCESKLWQQAMAAAAGFPVAPSMVTNEVSVIRRWASAPEGLIVKAIGDPFIPRLAPEVGQSTIMTSELSVELVSEFPGPIEPLPMFLQRRIEKHFEHRVVVVGERVFSFRIDPGQHKIMATDYRRGGYMVDYVPERLPQDILEQLLRLHESLGLDSGCYDFIERPDGAFVFLEVNANGIWALHDELVGGDITEAFSEMLLAAAYKQQTADGVGLTVQVQHAS